MFLYSLLGNLYLHFEANGVEFLQFSFRWMNNLLMREIPLRATIRLWDTYLVYLFTSIHRIIFRARRTVSRNSIPMFVAPFFGYGRDNCKMKKIFKYYFYKLFLNHSHLKGIMLMLQSLPTQNWNDQQICELTAGMLY